MRVVIIIVLWYFVVFHQTRGKASDDYSDKMANARPQTRLSLWNTLRYVTGCWTFYRGDVAQWSLFDLTA